MIFREQLYGIEDPQHANDVIEGNFIGTDITGNFTLANFDDIIVNNRLE